MERDTDQKGTYSFYQKEADLSLHIGWREGSSESLLYFLLVCLWLCYENRTQVHKKLGRYSTIVLYSQNQPDPFMNKALSPILIDSMVYYAVMWQKSKFTAMGQILLL